jgi:hypothetical protein
LGGRRDIIPTAAEGFVELDEVLGNGLIALHLRVLRFVERAFGIEHLQEIREAAFIELGGNFKGLLIRVYGLGEGLLADLFLGVGDERESTGL